MKKNVALLLSLFDRRNKVKEILETPIPIVKTLLDSHNRKISNAEEYLKELDLVIAFWSAENPCIEIVNVNTFYKKLSNSDTCFINFNGAFLKLACIGNFPNSNEWFLYMTPLKKL